MATGSFSGVKSGRNFAEPTPPSSAVVMKGYSYTSTPPIGRTARTEPQYLYKDALYLYLCYVYVRRSLSNDFVQDGQLRDHGSIPRRIQTFL